LDPNELVEGVISGEARSISRAITLIEGDSHQAFGLLKQLFPHTGKAHVVGVTGPPGAGKSTLTDHLIKLIRENGKRVGVIAVDPTSPFSGGAILGDRIRMTRHSGDPGVFIRSMATRGMLGGISRGTHDAVIVLEAAGFDVVIIETVGVGQDEVDIVNTAHSSVVVLVPGMGDEVQAIKAGILEIGDLFVINKSDRPGANRLETELRLTIEMAPVEEGWQPPIIKTVASEGKGVAELLTVIKEHGDHLKTGARGYRREVQRCRHRIRELWRELAMDRLLPRLLSEDELERAAEKMARRETEPYTLIEKLAKKIESP
jgi:LAO/AO transport system kinase